MNFISHAASEAAPSSLPPESPNDGAAGMSLEDMAREAAQRGRSVLRGYLAARTAAERATLKPIYAELEGLIPAE